MAWANPGIERRLQSWLWRSLSCRRKAQLPSFTAIHHSHHASPCRTWFRSRTKNYHNSVIFTTRMKTTTFLISLLLFWILEFFSRNWHFPRWQMKGFSKIWGQGPRGQGCSLFSLVFFVHPRLRLGLVFSVNFSRERVPRNDRVEYRHDGGVSHERRRSVKFTIRNLKRRSKYKESTHQRKTRP